MDDSLSQVGKKDLQEVEEKASYSEVHYVSSEERKGSWTGVTSVVRSTESKVTKTKVNILTDHVTIPLGGPPLQREIQAGLQGPEDPFVDERTESRQVSHVRQMLASQKVDEPAKDQMVTEKDSSIFVTTSDTDEMFNNIVKESSVGYLKDNFEPPGASYRYKPKRIEISTPKNAQYYCMTHSRRGKALIFNHDKFDNNLSKRQGSDVDRDAIRKQLKKLGFNVFLYENLKLGELRKEIKKVSSEDHSDADCLVVVVMSHGDPGIIHAYDSPYFIEELWYPFTGNNCLTLAGKPKLFFIQACRGNQADAGVQLQQRTRHDAAPQSYKIPSHADFFLACSSVDGYYSWRNPVAGSWFIQALCSELKHNGTKEELMTIMTSVNRKVALDYKSSVPGNPMMHEMTQVPTFYSTLTRHVLFTDKKHVERETVL